MKPRKRKGAVRRTLLMAGMTAAALALLLVLTLSRVLIVRDIMVVGNRNLLSEEIITQSGVQIGDHLLGRAVTHMKENLEKNRYIQFEGYDFDYKGRLTIRINERLGEGVVRVLGIYYVIDGQGVVLECTGGDYPTNVAGPKITGFDIEENVWIIAGEKLPVSDTNQLEEMSLVLQALEETNMLARVSQLDVTSFDDLFVMTSESVKIELGDSTSLKSKLLIAREIITQREAEDDLCGARIDVSSGKKAHYIPPKLPTPTPVPTATPTIGPTATPG